MNITNLHTLATTAILTLFVCSCSNPADQYRIDREALLSRNCPHVTTTDPLSSLTVGNGDFAMTVDVTGMQTFPEHYSEGVPLGTMSTWGWHSFENPKGFKPEDCYVPYDFGTGSKEALYSQQVGSKQAKENPRLAAAADYLRANPHRLHLGYVGFLLPEGITIDSLKDIDQTLLLLSGEVKSAFSLANAHYHVRTLCHAEHDEIGYFIEYSGEPLPMVVRIPGPTGMHSDDASDWSSAPEVSIEGQSIHVPYGYSIDVLSLTGCKLTPRGTGEVVIECEDNDMKQLALTLRWRQDGQPSDEPIDQPSEVLASSSKHWYEFWHNGAAVDFSQCKDPRAMEMERRVVLSQYLLAVNSAGHVPPQETGLTYNSWFGKFHLEMIYWHQAWLPLWGHGALLDRTLSWYQQPEPHAWAKNIAQRQGYRGVRWMKMTDLSGQEAPSKVGSFLIWQQPHPIYLAELLRRQGDDPTVVDRYYDLVMETATFMGDFAVWDADQNRFVLKGNIPAQETLKAAEVVNSPYELSEWLTTLKMAQSWRQLKGEEPVARWDSIITYLSPLAWSEGAADDSPFNVDSTRTYGKVYLACETTLDTYTDRRLTSDHMAVLGALGIYPSSRLIDEEIMSNTLSWVLDNWNWDKTWGWDYPMTAMCAARLNRPEDAVSILLNSERTNTYLPNGHNYQDDRLRCYLPGNGGLLTAVAMMCAGWDGCELGPNPGWPKDGNWDVKWEGLRAIP